MNNSTDSPETILSEETIYDGYIMSLVVRQIKMDNGVTSQREIMVNPGAVVIVPLTANNEVRLVRQYRSAAAKWVLELPAGTLDPDEAPAVAAVRELQEETGDQADQWQELHGFYTAPGALTEFLHLFLATDIRPGPNNLEDDETIEVVTLPWNDVIAMIRRHEIEDVKTIAGVMSAGLHLGLLGG